MAKWYLFGMVGVALVAGATYAILSSAAGRPAAGPVDSYTWKIEDKTVDEAQPRTQVSFVHAGRTYIIGTYDGTCAESDIDLLPNEESKVVCWFAGGGKEIGLFNEDGDRTVQVGDLDEGSAEIEGFRGNFQTAVSL